MQAKIKRSSFFTRPTCSTAATLLLASALVGCGGGRGSEEFVARAAAAAAQRAQAQAQAHADEHASAIAHTHEPVQAQARALAASSGPVLNRYDFSTGLLSLPGLRVEEGTRATCYDASLRTASTAPFVVELSSATEVACAAASTAPGSYQSSSGKLTLPGMTAVNGGATTCYDVVLNRVSANPIKLQLASATVAICAGAGSVNGTQGVECAYGYSSFNDSASVKLTSSVSWSCSSTARVLVANGVPDHAVGAFPSANNPNALTAQSVSASYSLAPTATTTATELGGPRGATGYVLNGVKIDPGTAGSCDNSGTACSLIGNTGNWSIEALGQTSFNFGVDASNGHVQPGGAYHYHGMPEGFIAKRGGGPDKMTLIGWAADGFPIYARYGYSVASDSTSALKVMTGSYSKLATPPANRPSTTTYPMGTFRQDWQYVAGSGDLDECNGRSGVTPEFPGGTYHYFATDTYPYLQRCVKGSVR